MSDWWVTGDDDGVLRYALRRELLLARYKETVVTLEEFTKPYSRLVKTIVRKEGGKE